MRKAYTVNLGCSENVIDGKLINAYLETNDWTMTDVPAEADLLIVNSCGVTADAERASVGTYQRLLAEKRPDARVIFGGCLPAINGAAVRGAGYEDVVVTPRKLHVLDSVIGAHVPIDRMRSGCIPASADSVGVSFTPTYITRYQEPLRKVLGALRRVPLLPLPGWLLQVLVVPTRDTEFVRISVGCLNHCSFCAIPRAKGSTKSVPADDVVERVRDAARRGKRSIALSCDELASYGQDIGTDIASLLDRITALPEPFDLVLRNVHPEWLIRYWPALAPVFRRERIAYMVIPFQSGSDKILRAMKRNHTTREALHVVQQLRAASPRVILRAPT